MYVGSDEEGTSGWTANGTVYPPPAGNRDIWTARTHSISEYIADVDRSVPEVSWVESGERSAWRALHAFLYSTAGEWGMGGAGQKSSVTC